MNLLTIFIFSMQMASDTCSNKKDLSKHYFASREDRLLVSHSSNSRGIPTCFCTFAPPRHVHTTREEILSAGKLKRSKNNFRGITMGRGPIWGSNYLTFMCSFRNTVSTKKQATFSFKFVQKEIWTLYEQERGHSKERCLLPIIISHMIINDKH